jgi:hypothetical protein
MKAGLTIHEVSLLTDQGLDSRQAMRLGRKLGEALAREWRAAGERADLVIDRLEIDARAADLRRADFTRAAARAAVGGLLRKRRG